MSTAQSLSTVLPPVVAGIASIFASVIDSLLAAKKQGVLCSLSCPPPDLRGTPLLGFAGLGGFVFGNATLRALSRCQTCSLVPSDTY